MMITVTIDHDLFEQARSLTAIEEPSALIHAALQALIQKKAGERLAALGGSMPDIKPVRRRRTTKPSV